MGGEVENGRVKGDGGWRWRIREGRRERVEEGDRKITKLYTGTQMWC